MSVKMKPELSQNNKYWIDKHRYYELKHFCLQYPEWKQIYSELEDVTIPLSMIDRIATDNLPGDPTAKRALMRTFYSDRIELIEKTAIKADPYLHSYIITGVTEGVSYTYLKTRLGIPCGRDMYYDKYRRFFWLLSNSRE